MQHSLLGIVKPAVKQPALMLAVAAQLKNIVCHSDRLHSVGYLAGEMQPLQPERIGQVEFLAIGNGRYSFCMENQRFILQTSRLKQGNAIMEGVSQGLCPVGTRVGWLADQGVGLPPDSPGLAQDIRE
ncbi:MAG: hypothetical protein ACE37N_10115 [Pseudohongiellaceae bacterium]